VSHTSQINPAEFVERVQPLLENQDFQGLLKLLRTSWSSDQIKELLSCKCGDARKVATLALGLVGARCCIPSLADQLQDPDPLANQMAEHALWSIWFRCGSECANTLLTRGAAAMDARDFETAEELFTEAIKADPAFAEAYHQRAIVRCLTERYGESVADCQEVVQRMPCHFGAWAGMGHAHAHLGQLPDAIRCYVKALKINPHLECLGECVKELRKQLKHPSGDEPIETD
jgi:tetratricopeptide (TPR) repeat protein